MKILMTGSNGMLGSDIIDIISKEHHVEGYDKKQLDITDSGSLKAVFASLKPDVVLHLAALTDLDYCENNPEDAYRVNSYATAEIAKLTAESNSSLIYISTSGVFPGDRDRPYSESDIPDPVSIYGKSKYIGEQLAIKHLNPKSILILRAGWLFGGGERDKKFVGKMFKLMKTLDEVKVVDDIYGSPIYSRDFGEAVNYLIHRKASGLFHLVNEGIVSRYEIALEMAKVAGLKTKITRAKAEDFPTKAPRPPMEGIVCNNLIEKYNYKTRNWKDALSDYIKRLEKEVK